MRDFLNELLGRLPFLEASPFGTPDQLIETAGDTLDSLDQGFADLFPSALPEEMLIDDLADLNRLR